MAFHLKNLKTQKDKFFSSMTGQQLCDIVTDGEIMNYINRLTYRAGEIDTIFASIAGACDVRKTIAPGVRQKTLAPLVIQLSKIIKEYEAKKVQLAANLVETQRKQKEAAAKMAVANVSFNLTKAENSALTKELSNLKRNFNSLSARLNKAIQNSRGTTRNVAAARRGGRRNATRKARRV
jgi:predicted metal-binding transcription factor (methanogenesis marker protein 9)